MNLWPFLQVFHTASCEFPHATYPPHPVLTRVSLLRPSNIHPLSSDFNLSPTLKTRISAIERNRQIEHVLRADIRQKEGEGGSMGIQAGAVLTTVYRLPRLWLTSLLAEASSDLTGPPSPSSSRESNSNMEEGLGKELWNKEREKQATGAGTTENIEEWETNQLQTQCRPPIQGLRTRPRPWPREVRQHGHPSPCQGWWSRISALRSPTGYRQGCRCVSNMIRRLHISH